jgi:long-chain acyl-CoA synthetase
MFPEKTLPQMLREQARLRPDKVAIRQKDFGIWKPISWKQYFERACDVGLGLRELGLKGGHVAVISENRIEWVLAQLGAGLAGAITVGVYPTSPANEVAYVLGHSDAEIVVCEDQEQVDKVLERRHELPKLRHVVVMEQKGARSYPADFVTTFARLEQIGRKVRTTQQGVIDEVLAGQSLNEIALVIYTSGSTGKPKGAMLSYGNLRAEAIAVAERIELNAETRHLSYLPLCHVAEQMLTTMAPLYIGSQVNFGETIRTVQEDLREVAPNMFLGVPRIWEKLHSAIHIKLTEAGGLRMKLFELGFAACAPFAERPTRRTFMEKLIFTFWYLLIFRALQNFIGLRSVKVAMTGAAPIPSKIVRFFRTIGVPLVEVYGATETSGMVTGQRLSELVPLCVGPAVEGAELQRGPEGELLVKGGVVFRGYYKNEAATKAAFTPDGWLRTGDVVEIVEGQFKIVDRLKDIMITAGGKNLSPSEIENTVKASPYIKECIVIGEARKYVSALIQIDPETVGQWAEEAGVTYTHFRSLAENPSVRDMIEREINKANGQLAQVANIRRFYLLTKELDHDDDEVTATMKVRRSNIQSKYASEIESLYAAS